MTGRSNVHGERVVSSGGCAGVCSSMRWCDGVQSLKVSVNPVT